MSEKLHLLLVEDSPEDIFTMRRYLELGGLTYELTNAETVEDAQTLVAQRHFDCILMDYQLPDNDGIELLKFVRASVQEPTAVILVTGSGSEQLAVDAMKAGAQDYITKHTLSPLRLHNTIKQSIQTVQLHATIEQQNTELKKVAAELKRSNEALNHFAYMASHDMRQPLRMITGYLQLLEQRYVAELDQDAKEFITFAIDGATRLNNLIEVLLRYSRVSTSSLKASHVNVNNLLKMLVRDLAPLVAEANATLDVRELPDVHGDQTLLWQVFQNLLTNAIRFRREETPSIVVGGTVQGTDTLFWVRDNGIGIHDEDFDQVFLLFRRLSDAQQMQGTGIGLATCKSIVEKHGGRIWFESTYGKGTTFYFTIPQQTL